MDLIERQSVLKAIDECERLSMVSQTVRNMTSLKEVVQGLPAVQTCEDAVSRQAAIDCATYDVEYTIECIKKLPSVQPQITHCAECIHWKHSDVRKNYCEVFDWTNTAEDFCSFAERKDTE